MFDRRPPPRRRRPRCRRPRRRPCPSLRSRRRPSLLNQGAIQGQPGPHRTHRTPPRHPRQGLTGGEECQNTERKIANTLLENRISF